MRGITIFVFNNNQVSSLLGELFNRLSAVLSDFSVNNDVLSEVFGSFEV
jgi:hypothetical protein